MLLINKFKKREESKLIVADNPLSRASEEFRMLRTNIQASLNYQKFVSIAVASPNSGDGKTTVAANLAASFAQERTTVLLVDTVLRNPGIHEILGVPNERGLTDLLTNQQLTVGDVAGESQLPNLYYLTAGKIPLNPAELLNSNRMAQLLKRMKIIYDVVIFDTPPVLSVTDARLIAAKADGTLLVFPESGVNATDLKETAALLNHVNANVLGTIMNKVDNK